MAYYGTNMVLAQAHWDSSNSGNNNVFQIATRADGGGTLGLAKGIN